MAKILFTAFLADMRGKVNGTVFSKNRGGAFARTKVTPTNPQTVFQAAVRATLTAFTQGWRALTVLQRAAWDAAVQSFPRTNVFGNSRILSGHQLYVGLNSQLAAAGQAALTNPPVPQGAAGIESLALTIDLSDSEAEVIFAPTVPAGHTMVIDMTAPMSPGINNYRNRFRQVATVIAASTSPVNLWDEYRARFGTPAVGQKVGLRARFVRNATGEVSGALTAEALVQA